jgi:hypothetical protein
MKSSDPATGQERSHGAKSGNRSMCETKFRNKLSTGSKSPWERALVLLVHFTRGASWQSANQSTDPNPFPLLSLP